MNNKLTNGAVVGFSALKTCILMGFSETREIDFFPVNLCNQLESLPS